MSTSGDRIAELCERLTALQSRLGPGSSPIERQVTEALNGLQLALQELEVTEEELAQQNEELLATRERLEMERHRYRDLFELAPDGYVVTDAAGTIEEANRAACTLLKTSTTALRGKPFSVYVPADEKPRFRSMLRGVSASQVLRDIEVVLQPMGRKPLHALLTVIRDEQKIGQPARLRWVIRDVSARRAAEAALHDSEERLRHAQRLESIGRLAGGIAHSFNNLLAAIGFHSELLLEELQGADRVHAEEIHKAGERAAALAGQLLAFGRRQMLQPRVLVVNAILLRMEPMLRRLLGEDIDLRLSLDTEAGAIEADLGQLEQVILNLAVNARDAMPFGGTLTLVTGRTELAADAERPPQLPPGSYLRLTVADTGTGMDEVVLARLFEPFFTTKENGKGTGLGLSTVHGIVLQSGGDIEVRSTPGVGTIFTILLPRTDAVAEEPKPAPPVPATARGSETILLVEDEDNIRVPAVEILESRGYKVLAASHAAEALAKTELHAGPIHLLVTDVVMPGMSGGQLAEHLSRLRPGVRVLYMSGYPEDAIAHHGVLEPGQRFLQKPFAVGLLLRTVREILESDSGAGAAAGG